MADNADLLIRSDQIGIPLAEPGSQFLKLKLDCPVFLGNHKDKFDFVNWYAQYETVISANKHLKNTPGPRLSMARLSKKHGQRNIDNFFLIHVKQG